MNGSGVVIEVYSADIGTHSLYSKIVSKLALVLLLNPTPLEYRSREINSRDTNERFRVVVEEYSTVFGTCLLYSQNRIKSIELVRRSGFRQGYGSRTSVVIESHSFGVQVTRDELS